MSEVLEMDKDNNTRHRTSIQEQRAFLVRQRSWIDNREGRGERLRVDEMIKTSSISISTSIYTISSAGF